MLCVTAGVAGKIAEACALAFPLEACGFLLGRPGPRVAVATDLVLVGGSTSSRDGFGIPDYELRRIKAHAIERSLAIIALLHSHPSGDPGLSKGDLATLRCSPWPWVIATRGDEALVLFGYSAGNARRIPLSVRCRT